MGAGSWMVSGHTPTESATQFRGYPARAGLPGSRCVTLPTARPTALPDDPASPEGLEGGPDLVGDRNDGPALPVDVHVHEPAHGRRLGRAGGEQTDPVGDAR